MVFGWRRKKAVSDDGINPGLARGNRDQAGGDAGVHTAGGMVVSIHEIDHMLDAMAKKQSTHLIEQTKKIQFPIIHHIESLLRIAVDLEKDRLDTDSIDINIVTIVKRGKKQVLDTIHKESERDLPALESVEDVKEFNRLASQTLTKIGDILGKQTRVIHIFAKKHAGRMKDILARYKEDIEHSKRLLDRFVEFEEGRDRVTELLAKIAAEQSVIKADTEKIAGLERAVSRTAAEISSAEDCIDKFKSSPTYRRHQEIRGKLDGLEAEKSRIANQINNQTILISRPVSKYEYASSLDKEGKEMLKKFLSSPFEVFVSKNRAAIVEMLGNIKKSVERGHLSVKEPEKTLGYIDEIVSGIDGFIRSVESCLAEQDRLRGELESVDLRQLEECQRRRAKALEEADFSRSRMAELRGEMEALEPNRPRYIREAESALSTVMGARCTIIESRDSGGDAP